MRTIRAQLAASPFRSRSALGVGVSVAFHLLVLAALVLGARNAMKSRFVESDLPVRLVPSIAVWPRLKPPPAAAPAKSVIHARLPKTAPLASAPPPLLVAPPAPQAQPAPPAPPAPPQPARAPLLDLGGAMQKVLGCSDLARAGMTAAQRAECDKRMGADVENTKKLPLTIPPDKKAAWDREVWKRNHRSNQPFVPCTGPGSNYGLSCIPEKLRPPPAGSSEYD